MKVQYLVPGPMSKGPMGRTEMDRREGLLNAWAFPGTTVVVVDVPEGPASIESVYEEMLAIPETLEGVSRAERDGFDAAKAALKAAEGLVSQGLSHSKRGYPTPPKLRSIPQEVVA